MRSSPTWFAIAATFLSTTACDNGPRLPPPPPIVLSMSPTSGAYGTEVTITGEHFGRASDAGGLALEGARDASVIEWTDTRIRFRYPFPASGDVTVQGPGGVVSAGTFTPDALPWRVSEVLGASPIAATMLADGTVGAVMQMGAHDADASVVLASTSGHVTAHDLGRTIADLALVDVFEAEAGTVEGFFVGAYSTVYYLAWDPTSGPALRDSGVHPKSALAGGRDTSGTYLWTVLPDDAQGHYGPLARYRAPTVAGDAFTNDLSITIPFVVQDATAALRGDVAADGTLFVVWGKYAGSVFDQQASPLLSRIVPSTLDWTDTVLGAKVDDYVVGSETLVSSDGTRVLARYCWTNRNFNPTDPTDPTVTHDCVGPLDEGAAPLAAAPSTDFHLDALTTDGLVTVDGDVETGWIVETPSGSTTLSIWPAEPKWVLHHDAYGPSLIVEASGAYVVRPAP